MSMQNDHARRRHLFLCGVARSGTTVTSHLLNAHPQIVMGIERFKYAYRKTWGEGESLSSLLTFERFFDFRPDDTNHYDPQAMKLYERSRAKYQDALYVGDKMPRMYKMLGHVAGALENTKFLYIVRNPADVCSSWEVRARNPKDKWGDRDNWSEGLKEWNSGNAMVLKYINRNPGHVLVLSYEDMYSASEAPIRAMFDWLDLDYHPDVATYLSTKIAPTASIVSNKQSVLSEENIEQIAATADFAVRDELFSKAGLKAA